MSSHPASRLAKSLTKYTAARPTRRRRRRRDRLYLEQLENRTVPATFVVNLPTDMPEPVLTYGDGECDINVLTPQDECTLRAAIDESNALPGRDTILFNIPGIPAAAWATIALTPGLSLPPISDPAGLLINGFSQPDSNPGTLGSGERPGVDDAANPCQPLVFQKPDVAVDGNAAPVIFTINGNVSNVTIRGLSVYDSLFNAVFAGGGPGTNRVIESMFVGVLPDGSDPGLERNKRFGVQQGDAGVLEVRDNYVGFNGQGGIDGQASTSVVIAERNEVFENGWASLAHDGIDLNGINSVGRCNLSRDNRTLAVNGGSGTGIELGSQANAVTFNLVEYNTLRNNLGAGVSIRRGSSGNFVLKNVITENIVGIAVNREGTTSHLNVLSKNSIFMNFGLGIDLQHQVTDLVQWVGSPDGGNDTPTTGQDHCDGDTGSNDLQNYPELIGAFTTGGQIRLEGRLNSVPGFTYVIEFFSTPDGTTFTTLDREGKTFIGEVLVTIDALDADCTQEFSRNFNVTVGDDEVITATATPLWMRPNDPRSTSEFSRPITVNQLDLSAKVTGGGWYLQPAAAQPAPDPTDDQEDRSSLGFNAKYHRSDPVPRGHTNFLYHPLNLHFSSTAYEPLSLIVTRAARRQGPASRASARRAATLRPRARPGRGQAPRGADRTGSRGPAGAPERTLCRMHRLPRSPRTLLPTYCGDAA